MSNSPVNKQVALSPIVTEQALEQAARWFVDLQENQHSLDANKSYHRDFTLWLQSSENQQAWQQISQIHQQYQNHQSQLHSQALNNNQSANLLYNNVKLSRRGMLKSFAGLSCASWLGWQGYHSPLLQNKFSSLTADVSSAVGQSKQLTFSNNEKLWLNTNTALNTLANHELELIKGEVFLDNFTRQIKTTVNQQLLTLSAQTSAGNSGAYCTMQINEDHSQCSLALYQGSASVHHQGQSRRLVVGQHLLLTANKEGEFNLANAPTTPLSFRDKPPWLDGQLHANDIPLTEFINELKRYRSGYIHLQTELAQIRVAGVYPAFDSDAALNLLAKALPIRINYLTPWFVSISSS